MWSWIIQPWPWYVAGPLIGLMVPALLLAGNKHFGLSANLRHACAACFPANIPFFNYDYRKERWNMMFVIGILAGALLAANWLVATTTVPVSPALKQELAGYGITDYSSIVPVQLYSWKALFTVRGLVMMVGGGFLVGFGSRYAGGCTSGHAITGLSTLQWPSLVATASFMIGGLIMANVFLPFLLR